MTDLTLPHADCLSSSQTPATATATKQLGELTLTDVDPPTKDVNDLMIDPRTPMCRVVQIVDGGRLAELRYSFYDKNVIWADVEFLTEDDYMGLANRNVCKVLMRIFYHSIASPAKTKMAAERLSQSKK